MSVDVLVFQQCELTISEGDCSVLLPVDERSLRAVSGSISLYLQQIKGSGIHPNYDIFVEAIWNLTRSGREKVGQLSLYDLEFYSNKSLNSHGNGLRHIVDISRYVEASLSRPAAKLTHLAVSIVPQESIKANTVAVLDSVSLIVD